MLIAESADARKSTAIKKAVSFFEENVAEFRIAHGVNSAEGLQKLLSKKLNLLLRFDELKQFIGKCDIQSSTLLECVT